MKHPNLKEEKKLWKKGCKRIVGLDEAGRGPLAGPIMAAAVLVRKISKSKFQNLKIKDSKKLTAKKRKEFYEILIKNPNIEWGIGRASERVIDRINILEATKLAMKRAVKNLERKAQKTHDRENFVQLDFLILDGNIKLNLPISQKSIIKADNKVFSCAASSIIAKETRDRMMKKYHQKYPQYGFDKHKGYATKLHRKMLKKYGPCKIHRKTFRPIKKLLNC